MSRLADDANDAPRRRIVIDMPIAATDTVTPTLVTGLFADHAAAERAFRSCVDRGYAIGDINVVMSEEARKQLLAEGSSAAAEMSDRTAEGGELGGPTGGRAAVLITVFAAVGAALAVPALGLVVAGPVAAALMGAGGAGLAAGLIGTLSDWGLPEDRVREYETALRRDGILVGVAARSEDDAAAIEREWMALGAQHVHR